MTIQVTLNANEFTRTGTYNDREYTSLKIDRISNGRVYFTTIKDNMRWSLMAKQMKLENGNVVISFGKNDKMIIGTYVDTDVIEETEPKKETVCEPIQKIDMIADYAQINYLNNQAIITFTNNKESNTITFNYRKSWSHRKYIDKALEQSGIKPSWEFKYGWEYKAV